MTLIDWGKKTIFAKEFRKPQRVFFIIISYYDDWGTSELICLRHQKSLGWPCVQLLRRLRLLFNAGIERLYPLVKRFEQLSRHLRKFGFYMILKACTVIWRRWNVTKTFGDFIKGRKKWRFKWYLTIWQIKHFLYKTRRLSNVKFSGNNM